MGATVNAATILMFSPDLGFLSGVLKVIKDVLKSDRRSGITSVKS
jgi:hypothetical protein